MPFYFNPQTGVIVAASARGIELSGKQAAETADFIRGGECASCAHVYMAPDFFRCCNPASLFFNIEFEQPGSLVLGCSVYLAKEAAPLNEQEKVEFLRLRVENAKLANANQALTTEVAALRADNQQLRVASVNAVLALVETRAVIDNLLNLPAHQAIIASGLFEMLER